VAYLGLVLVVVSTVVILVLLVALVVDVVLKVAAVVVVSVNAWNGYITLIHNPLKRHPLLSTVTVNAPEDPLLIGGCSPDGGCKAAMDFLDVHFDSSGHP